MRTVEQNVEFESEGVICRGFFVRPVGDRCVPLVVLVHGLGGIYEMRLDAYARRFADAGYAALTFDYRYFGRSDGVPRQLLRRAEQQADIGNALAFGKSLPGVDASRVVLWGTSLGGGHVLDVASRREDLAACIIQAPFTDGPASVRATSFISLLGILSFSFRDAVSRLFGGKPVLVPLAATPHLPALMTKPDVVGDVLDLFPAGSHLSERLSSLYAKFADKALTLPSTVSVSNLPEPSENGRLIGSTILPSGTVLLNGVSANIGLELMFWRPGKQIEAIKTPLLVCACTNDSVAPVAQTIAYAKRGTSCELRTYPYRHFEIYVGEPFEIAVRDQIAFLERTVPVALEA